MAVAKIGGTKLFKRGKAFHYRRDLRRKVISMERQLAQNTAVAQDAKHVKELEAQISELKGIISTLVTILPSSTRKKIPKETISLLGIKEK